MSTPFIPTGHPLTIQFLNQVLPGKSVKDFSIHFPMDGVVTMRAEINLIEEDVAKLTQLAVEYELSVKEKE